MDKKKLIMISISAVLLIAICVTIGISGVLSPYQRQIRLGYKLLEQGNYEEAILAFDKAIEIDVKRAKAYIGKADVYVTRCDENTLEDVKSAIETGYAQHHDDKAFVEALIRLSKELYDNNKSDWAIALLDFGYELTQDEQIKAYKDTILKEISNSILAYLFELFEKGDNEAVKKEIQSEKYLKLNAIAPEDYKYIYIPDEKENGTGKGVAIYAVSSKQYGNIFAYYGDFYEGVRSGFGTWIGAKDGDFYWFEGQWSDDAPNGEGEITETYNNLEREAEQYPIVVNVKGTFANGLYHGSISEVWSMNTGETWKWSTITASNGIYHERSDLSEPHEDGSYCVSEAQEESAYLFSNGEKVAIVGFGDK